MQFDAVYCPQHQTGSRECQGEGATGGQPATLASEVGRSVQFETSGLGSAPGVHSPYMSRDRDEHLWDAVRSALVTSGVQSASREDALAVASAEVGLMRLRDRGARCPSVTLHVAGDVITGRIDVWADEVVVVEGVSCTWAVRTGAIDVIAGLPRALRSESEDSRSVRSILDEWAGAQVDVATGSGEISGLLVVASDHLEVGAWVIPWRSVRFVRRRA